MNIQKNVLHEYLQLLRSKNGEAGGYALKNIIRTMELARNGRIFSEDFSGLAFHNIRLNEISFSSSAEDASTFENSVFDENAFTSGHVGCINAAAWNGNMILTAGEDNTAILWDASTHFMIRRLTGHTGAVNACAFTPDGRCCITGSSDRTLKVWDVQSGACIRTLRGHFLGVTAVSVSADGKFCLSGSEDTSAKLWELRTGRCLKTVSYSGWKTLERFIKCRYYRSREKNLLDDCIELLGDIYAGYCFIAGKHFSSIDEFWDSTVRAVNFSPDGQYFVIGTKRETDLWSRDSRKPVYHFEWYPDWMKSFDNDRIFRIICNAWEWKYLPVVFLDESSFVKSSLKEIAISSNSVPEDDIYIVYIEQPVCISPDGKTLLTVRGSTIEFRDLEEPERVQATVRSYLHTVTAVSHTPDGKYLLTGSGTGACSLWDMQGNFIKTIGQIEGSIDSIIVSEDSEVCSVISTYCSLSAGSGRYAAVYQISTGELLQPYEDTDIYGYPFGRYSVCTMHGHTLTEGEISVRGSSAEISMLGDQPEVFYGKAFAFSETLHPRGWNSETVDEKKTVYAFAFSPDGSRIIEGFQDRTAVIFDTVGSRKPVTLQYHRAPVTAVQFSSDGRRVLTGSDDGAVLWDAETGRKRRVFTVPKKENCRILWDFPYCYLINGHQLQVYRIGVFDDHPEQKKAIPVCSIENIVDISVRNCNFKGAAVSDRLRTILLKNGAFF